MFALGLHAQTAEVRFVWNLQTSKNYGAVQH